MIINSGSGLADPDQGISYSSPFYTGSAKFFIMLSATQVFTIVISSANNSTVFTIIALK